ncbi:MAG: transposase [Acetobacteraceae bacterium]
MRAISEDLRHRVCEAVVVEGLSRRAAARRFKVGVSSVIRWCARLKDTGSVAPGRIEAEAAFILNRVDAKRDITLAELQAELAGRGVRVSRGALWRFFQRHDITLKKRMARPVCKGDSGWHVGLHQRIRSQGFNPGQDGFRAPRAS